MRGSVRFGAETHGPCSSIENGDPYKGTGFFYIVALKNNEKKPRCFSFDLVHVRSRDFTKIMGSFDLVDGHSSDSPK